MAAQSRPNPDNFSLDFNASLEELHKAETAITEYLAVQDFHSLDIHGIFLTFHEHCLNIIEHGYPPEKRGPVCLNLAIQPSEHGRRVVMTIRDEAREFNSAEHPDSGIGISLIRSIAKIVEWEREGKENRTVFIFKVFRTAEK
jgi:anti-sigma regulatory factor (Ser/Thr protein kinase)